MILTKEVQRHIDRVIMVAECGSNCNSATSSLLNSRRCKEPAFIVTNTEETNEIHQRSTGSGSQAHGQ